MKNKTRILFSTKYVYTVYLFDGMLSGWKNKLWTLIWNVESILELKIVAITFVLCLWASRKANTSILPQTGWIKLIVIDIQCETSKV